MRSKPLREQKIMSIRVCVSMAEYDMIMAAAIAAERSLSNFCATAAIRTARASKKAPLPPNNRKNALPTPRQKVPLA